MNIYSFKFLQQIQQQSQIYIFLLKKKSLQKL